MLKKYGKYFFVVIANALTLCILLFIWTDPVEVTFNNDVRINELLKIAGVSVISILAIRILIALFRKKGIVHTPSKIKPVLLVIVLISSYMYINYFINIFNNRILYADIRKSIESKIKPAKYRLAYGISAEHLNIKEYQEIKKTSWLPKISVAATNISYSFSYDGFLPDYYLSLVYDVPKNTYIEAINYEDRIFTKYQSFKIINNKKKVDYTEIQH